MLRLAYEPSLDQAGHKFGPLSAQVNVSGLLLVYGIFLERIYIVDPPICRYLCQKSSYKTGGT